MMAIIPHDSNKLHKSVAGVSCKEGPQEELWSGQLAELIYAHLCHKKVSGV